MALATDKLLRAILMAQAVMIPAEPEEEDDSLEDKLTVAVARAIEMTRSANRTFGSNN